MHLAPFSVKVHNKAFKADALKGAPLGSNILRL